MILPLTSLTGFNVYDINNRIKFVPVLDRYTSVGLTYIRAYLVVHLLPIVSFT